MADSVVMRGDAIAPLSHEPKSSLYLKVGVFQTAVLRLLEYYRTPENVCAEHDWKGYLQESAKSVIPWLGNETRDGGYPLDRFSVGRGLLYEYVLSFSCNPFCFQVIDAKNRYATTQNTTAKNTLDTLRQSLDIQPLNALGGYWFFTYPNWSYLDGMYSLIPFLTYYTKHFDKTAAPAVADNIIHQLDLLWTHCRENATGLLVHGYDASPGDRKASWANSVTGASPFAWSRSLGWYFISLIDALEIVVGAKDVFPARLEQYLLSRFVVLARAVVRAADTETGCWWQVMEYPGREGNYIESSGSAMFTYGLYKGVRLGYLPQASAKENTGIAEKCYRHLINAFIVDNKNGTLGYNGTVGVCSLNSSATYEVCSYRVIVDDKSSANRIFSSIMSRSLWCITASTGQQHFPLRAWSMKSCTVVTVSSYGHGFYIGLYSQIPKQPWELHHLFCCNIVHRYGQGSCPESQWILQEKNCLK